MQTANGRALIMRTANALSPQQLSDCLGMDARIEFEQFFWRPVLVFKLIGYDFLRNVKSRWQQRALYAFMGATIGVHLYCKYHMFRHFYDILPVSDATTIMYSAAYISYAADSNLKFITFVVNQRHLRDIYHKLQRIYPKTALQRRQHRVEAYYWSKAVRVVLALFLVAGTAVVMGPLVETLIRYLRTATDESASFGYLKPFPMPYDFDHRTPFGYVLAYAFELINGSFTTASNIGPDLWMISYTMQLCMHLEYIGNTLQQYEPHDHDISVDAKFLAALIQKHQIIYRLHDELNEIFGIPLIFSLMSTGSSVCMLSVLLTLQGWAWSSISYFIFVVSIIIQLFMVCFYGQKLITLSQEVSMAAYKNNWCNASVAYKNILLFIMLRSQKQAELSAKGFQPISLATFQMVLGMTYRIFAVVRTMIEK